MKKYFSISLLFIALCAPAQYKKSMFSKDPILNLENWDKSRLTWGYYLGFNAYDFKIDYKEEAPDILVDQTTGFNVGLVGDVRLHEHINLRFEPGLYYTQRILNYSDPILIKEIDKRREVNSTYIHLPLLLKFSSLRTGNIKPYLLGGVSTTLNLASNSKAKADNTEQRFRVNKWTNNYELGFGVDFYTPYFKFSPSIRGVFGLNDELIRDNDPNSPWTGNIASLKSRAVFINFTFQ
jgi:Outer membrane protein beta-barrel domain